MFVLVQAYFVGSSLLAFVTATAPQCQGASCQSHEEDRHSLLQSFRKQSDSQILDTQSDSQNRDCVSADSCGKRCYKHSTGSYGVCDANGHCKDGSVQCLPQCKGDSKTWSAGWGDCQTYSKNKPNSNHCETDRADRSSLKNAGLSASQVCPECGMCTEKTTTTTTTTTTTEALPSCMGNPQTWASDYGDCQTYGKSNFNYCDSDRDSAGTSRVNHGLLASEVCTECGKCTVTTTTTTSYVLACMGDSETWASPHGPCYTYAPPGSNFRHCSDDTDKSGAHIMNFGLSASAVCEECGVCTKVTPPTTTTTTPCAVWGQDPWDPALNPDFKFNPKRAQCCGDARVVECEYGQRCGYCPPCARTGEDIWNPKWPSTPVICCDNTNALNCYGVMICGKCPTTTTTTPPCVASGKEPWDPIRNVDLECCGKYTKVVHCQYGPRCGYCPSCAKSVGNVWHRDVWSPKWPQNERPVVCCDRSQPKNCDGKIVCGKCPTTTTTSTTSATMTMPQYERAKNGMCEPPYDYIQDKAGCEAAATALELKDTGAGTEKTSGSSGADYPQGCYYISKNSDPKKRLYFRKSGSISSSSTTRRAICSLATTTTTTMPQYERAKNGMCEAPYGYIQDKAGCEAAATALELKDTGAGTEKTSGSSGADYPQGCYYISKNSDPKKRLYFRKSGSLSSSSNARRAICVLLG